MSAWSPFPYAGEYAFTVASIRNQWDRLHAGDREPLPQDDPLLQAWAHFHNGDFFEATALGLSLGSAGVNVVNKATCIYATYLEKRESRRLALFLDVAERAGQALALDPNNLNAYYLRAYALSRYSQCISVAKALAQGLGTKVRVDLETVIRRDPHHADAHIALGSFHAEVIDKVGAMVGAMTYGANKKVGLELFTRALKLNVQSALGMVEYAQAILMLEGEKMLADAAHLYQKAASAQPADAWERLEVELAKAEIDG